MSMFILMGGGVLFLFVFCLPNKWKGQFNMFN